MVADYHGEIAGFLSFKIHTNKTDRYAAGGLGAVTPKHRDKNIFRQIAEAGLFWGKENGLDWEEHNVLITNYPVNRSFSKIGFKVFRSFVTLHYWYH